MQQLRHCLAVLLAVLVLAGCSTSARVPTVATSAPSPAVAMASASVAPSTALPSVVSPSATPVPTSHPVSPTIPPSATSVLQPPSTTKSASPQLEVAFIDVGQGDSILITSPDGRAALIDGGEAGSGANQYLRDKGVKSLDLIVATHLRFLASARRIC